MAEPWLKERVKWELDELEHNAGELHAHIYAVPRPKELTDELRDLLKTQYQCMAHYADVLRARLELMR